MQQFWAGISGIRAAVRRLRRPKRGGKHAHSAADVKSCTILWRFCVMPLHPRLPKRGGKHARSAADVEICTILWRFRVILVHPPHHRCARERPQRRQRRRQQHREAKWKQRAEKEKEEASKRLAAGKVSSKRT